MSSAMRTNQRIMAPSLVVFLSAAHTASRAASAHCPRISLAPRPQEHENPRGVGKGRLLAACCPMRVLGPVTRLGLVRTGKTDPKAPDASVRYEEARTYNIAPCPLRARGVRPALTRGS